MVKAHKTLPAIFSLVLLLNAAAVQAAESSWLRLDNGIIHAYTQGDPAQAESLVHSFAQLGNAFAQASAFHPVLDGELKVIVCNAKDFNLYRLNAGSSALYQQTARGEYVVLQTGGPARQEVALHEYTHFLMAHSHVALPLWLNEGLADFYSTFSVAGDEVTFGGAVSGRLSILRSSAWLPLERLFDVSTSSTDYMDPHRMIMFYSESWILAHLLVTDPRYAERFPLFLRCLNDGHSAAEGLQTIFGKSPAQVEEDLREHAKTPRLTTVAFRIKPPVDSAAVSTARPVTNAEMQVALADLTVTDPAARATLETRLAAAASESPQSPAAEESLGFLALRQGKEEDARSHFRLAIARHSADPSVLFYLAHLDHAAGAPVAQTMPLLERALSIKPDLNDARLELGLEAAGDGKFEQALAALEKLSSTRPENAYAAAYTVAYCYANTDQLTEARAAIRRAQPLAANDHDRAELAQLSTFIDQQAQN